MRSVTLPALRGDDHLGFLAALGLAWLLHRDGREPTFGWPQGATGGMTLQANDLNDLPAMARYVHDAARTMQQRGQLWHGCDALPLRVTGTTDPMKSLDVDDVRAGVAAADRTGAEERWWLPAFANQLARNRDGDGPLQTPFYRLTGRMTLDNDLSSARDLVAGDLAVATEALVGWRRHRGFFGGNLDQRATRGQAEPNDGTDASGQLGVPGATWLAYHALPWFPGHGNGRQGGFRGWQRLRRGGRTATYLVWPVWTQPLDPPAVWSVLDHPALRQRDRGEGGALPSMGTTLTVLGVEGVYASRAMVAADVGKSSGAGPLGPAERLWPAVT